LTIWSPIPLIT